MAGRGGYQPPANPAPVGLPGALSQRTDVPATQAPMPMTGGSYGEATEMAEIQAGADMFAQAPPGLMAPDDRPDIPLTAGIDRGPGPGSEGLRKSKAYSDDMSGLNKYLPMMERMAGRVDAPNGFRALVQYIKAYSGSAGAQ